MYLGIALSILALLSIAYARKKFTSPKASAKKGTAVSKQSLPERLLANSGEVSPAGELNDEIDSIVDGPSMVRQFAERSKKFARKSAWARGLGILIPLVGTALVIKLAPLITLNDIEFWDEQSILTDPALDTINGEDSVFRNNVESAAARRNKRLLKVSSAKVAAEKYALEIESSKSALTTFNPRALETSIKQNLDKQIQQAEKAIPAMEKNLAKLEAKGNNEGIPDVRNYQKQQEEVRKARLELSNTKNLLLDLKNKVADSRHVKDKVEERKQELLLGASDSEENLQKALAKQKLEAKYLQEADKLYSLALNEYLETLDKAKGKSASKTYMSSLNTLRLMGLIILSGIAWQLFKLSDYYLKLSTFYRSRSDLINAYIINDYELDVSVADTLNMFSPHQTYTSSSTGSQLTVDPSNAEKLSIANS